MARLTGMKELPRDRVALELDGHPWRVVPTDAVVRATLRVGEELDRGRLREFRRALRRTEARGIATRSLARRDATRAELATRLERGGVQAPVRDETLDRLAESGAVDDGRYARGRAALLARRGYGNGAVRLDLEQRGVGSAEIEATLEELEPEGVRAARLLARDGVTPKSLAALSRRGFEDGLVADLGDQLG